MSAFIPSVEQAAIINAPAQDDVLVVAGAGSGKTFTMTQRIIALINRGVAPERILGLTFTRKAAGELLERVSAAVSREDSPAAQGAQTPGASTPNFDRAFLKPAIFTMMPSSKPSCANMVCWLVSIRILSHSARLERSSSPLKSSMSIWIRL